MENAILFGNGLNLINGGISWDDLLKKISKNKSLIESIPNTLKYESIILSYDHETFIYTDEQESMISNGKIILEEVIKNKISEELKLFTTNDIYEKIGDLDIEHYLTTNYDCTLYNHLIDRDYKEVNSNNSEALYSIRRKFGVQNKARNKSKYIWTIHGTIKHPKSIMLGLDHYCGSVGKINDYIKGNYEFKENGTSKTLKGIIHRLKNKDCESTLSWIDLFFTHNIHILGLGLSYEEIDLWWILNKRQRYIKNSIEGKVIKNKIYYYGDAPEEKKILLEKLGVDVISYPFNDNVTNYEKQYEYFIDEIKKIIDK